MDRILVVEDDTFFRELYSGLLREEGYEVDTASGGREGLAALTERSYQLVLTDMVMPDLSGIELLTAAKRLDPTLDIILVTGHADVETAIFALKNGARDYLIKPVNHDEFKHAVALCLEQRHLLDENSELKNLVRLYQLGQSIVHCLDLERLYGLIMDALSKELGLSRGLLFSTVDQQLRVKEVRGIGEDKAKLLIPAVLEQLTHGERTEITPRTELLEITDASEDINGALLLHIRSRGVEQGLLVLFNRRRMDLPILRDERDVGFLLDQSALALENGIRYTSVKNLIYTDELTGLFNYRYLDVALDRELKRAERYGSNLSVIFIDLDLFKQVNDTHGHLVGSKVLREVATLIRCSVRDVDVIIRYGGDEYTVILVETGEQVAAIVAERIRAAIHGHGFLADEGYDIRLSACLGYACYPDDARSRQELLDLADQAMYRGKAGGKNMVFHAGMK